VRGRIEREAGESDSALSAFNAYLAAGGDSGVGLLELARTMYYARRPAQGWAAYFAGAHAATSAQALTMYRLDLSWIADSSDLAAFDGLRDPEARQRWLEQFWTRRDVVEARDVASAGGALSALVFRAPQLPSRQPPSPLRHHRSVPPHAGGIRRPRGDLPAPRGARQARPVRLPGSTGPQWRGLRAERKLAVSPRWG